MVTDSQVRRLFAMKNKAKTNPICQRAKNDAKCVFTKGYEYNADMGYEKQTQTNPISRHSVRKEAYGHERLYPSYFYEDFVGCCW